MDAKVLSITEFNDNSSMSNSLISRYNHNKEVLYDVHKEY